MKRTKRDKKFIEGLYLLGWHFNNSIDEQDVIDLPNVSYRGRSKALANLWGVTPKDVPWQDLQLAKAYAYDRQIVVNAKEVIENRARFNKLKRIREIL